MLLHIPPQRAVKGHPTRRNVEEHELPNAPKMQSQGKVTNVEFIEAIRMSIQDMTHQVGPQRGDQKKGMTL